MEKYTTFFENLENEFYVAFNDAGYVCKLNLGIIRIPVAVQTENTEIVQHYDLDSFVDFLQNNCTQQKSENIQKEIYDYFSNKKSILNKSLYDKVKDPYTQLQITSVYIDTKFMKEIFDFGKQLLEKKSNEQGLKKQ